MAASKKKRLTVLIADDQTLFREGIKDLVIKNEIYGIVEQENKASKHAPSAQMLAVAQRASTMETQLWYDDDDQLKDLVA